MLFLTLFDASYDTSISQTSKIQERATEPKVVWCVSRGVRVQIAKQKEQIYTVGFRSNVLARFLAYSILHRRSFKLPCMNPYTIKVEDLGNEGRYCVCSRRSQAFTDHTNNLNVMFGHQPAIAPTCRHIHHPFSKMRPSQSSIQLAGDGRNTMSGHRRFDEALSGPLRVAEYHRACSARATREARATCSCLPP